MIKRIILFPLFSLALILVSCGNDTKTEQQGDVATAKKAKAPTYVTMPANTEIAVSLVDSIDTDVQVTGAEFRARLSRPVVVDGHTLFAEGANAKGILDKVVESGRLKTPAELNVSLTAIQDKNGHWVDVGTVMIQEKKDSHTKREVAMIGGGAIIGGIIGKVVDKKGSTEIGAAAGAAAGTGLSAATGKQDIFHGVGTEVVFFSSQAMQIALE
jgi:outer membrane lipoprotein SlyB